MNKNKLRVGLAAVAAGLMLAGCGTPDGADVVLFERVPIPITIVEPVETAPTVTDAAQAADGFEFGDIAWSLWQDSEGQMRLSRHAVVAQEGEFLVVTTAITDSADAMRQVLPEYLRDMERDHPEECLELMLVAECYATEAEAQAAADAENGG